MRPTIGITCNFEQGSAIPGRLRSVLNAAYSDAVYVAGGLPLPIALPPRVEGELLEEILARCDGLLFTGGPDLDPRHYGQPRHEMTRVMHPRRDAFELNFFRAAEQADKPLLAICLGCQVAGVACGGRLVQHVDDLPRPVQVQHYLPDHRDAFHPVRVEPGSLLAEIVGGFEFEVNSRHHQAVDRAHLPPRLRPVAFAPDGVVEAVEDAARRFLLAVQWHPEDLIDRPEHLRLFEVLVRAARRA
jgi:gamma-glutamyl-gamma-aminobutyrate hydrolase PuuD